VEEIRATGARIKFISDGDVAGAIMAARPGTGVDLLLGIGGTPEGIIAACAMKALGGTIQGRLWPTDDEERQRALDAGHDLDPDHVLSNDDLVSGDDVFFVATGITDGELLQGVRYYAGGATTQSGHAFAQRHHPVDHLRAQAHQAAGVRRGRALSRRAGHGAADMSTSAASTATAVVVGESLVDVLGADRVPGGSPLNVAVGLARLGVPTTLLTQLGADADGDLIRAHAEASGVTVRAQPVPRTGTAVATERKSTRLNSSHVKISYAVFCLKKK